MSMRRGHPLPPDMLHEKPERGRCVAAICFSWKVITCIVSHVTLVLMVVSYCVGGAYLFQHLEAQHEIDVKKDIQYLRKNLSHKIWKYFNEASLLREYDWNNTIGTDLSHFEKQIIDQMQHKGWDGDEDITKTHWTFAGSLFYSIIVITTIGYGHISPRTDWGKVTTIFYAIVGIPLMLLCLSNIGDIMATSFRFVYWRVCCYVCTRSSHKSHRHRSRHRSMRSQRYSSRSQPPPFRRSMRLTQRSVNDSGVGNSLGHGGMAHAYSDPELRRMDPNDYDFQHRRGSSRRHAHHRQSARYMMPPYDDLDDGLPYNAEEENPYRSSQRFSGRQRNRYRMQDRHTIERERNLNRSKQYFDSIEELNAEPEPLPPVAKRSYSVRSMRSPNTRQKNDEPESRGMRELNRLHSQTLPRGRSMPHGGGVTSSRGRAKSVDPRVFAPQFDNIDEDVIRKTPIIPNRYALEEFDHQREVINQKNKLRSQSMPSKQAKQQHRKSEPASYRDGRDESPPPRHRTHQHHSQRGHNDHHQYEEQQQRQHHQRLEQQRQFESQSHRSRYGNHLELPDAATGGMRQPRRGRSRSRSPRPNDDYVTTHPARQARGRSPRPRAEYYDGHQRGRSPRSGAAEYDDGRRRGRSPRPRAADYDDAYDERYYDDYDVEAGYDDFAGHEMRQHGRRQIRRQRSEKLPPSPRIMSPIGFAVKRQIRRRPSYDYDDDSMNDYWDDYYGDTSPKNRPVPIWLCVFLVISYILGGAALFAHWEKWSFLDSAYFCFITLTTIGFGDFVPAKGVQDESEQSIAYCSLYLLFGISLLAMSFNLVQEEFIANVKELARRMGILKDDDDDDD